MPKAMPRRRGKALVTTRLESELLDELASRAEESDRTVSAELRRAVRFYLANSPREHVAAKSRSRPAPRG